MSGGYADHDMSTSRVDVYTKNDSLKRILMIHGKDDVATELSKYLNVFPRKIDTLNNKNIPNYTITVCNTGHNIISLITQDFIYSTLAIDKPNDRNYSFYNFVSGLNNTNINTMVSSMNSNGTYKAFFDTLSAINSQTFQIHKAGSQFYVNAINNTPYVMCATESSSNRKAYIGINGLPIPTPYISSDWIYQLRDSNCEPLNSQRISKGEVTTKIPFAPKTSLYPNPNNGLFNAQVKIEERVENYQISVFNTLGAIVFEQNITESIEAGNSIQKQIDISQQAKGLYYIQIRSGEKILINEKS